MSSATKVLPIITIQHDFETVIADVRDGTIDAEDFWVSCYKKGETSVHGKVWVSIDGGEISLTSRDGVELGKEGAHYYASCPALSIPRTRLRAPRQTIRDAEMPESRHDRQINSFDIAPDLAQIALGYNNGSIRRLPLSTHVHLQNGSGTAASRAQVKSMTYRSHIAAITSIRYFPSSRVILAAGADFSLTILDADPSSSSPTPDKPARVLKGHSRSVTDTAIIGRGRNVLSCAKDGTVRLWDVAGGRQIRAMGVKRYSAVNGMALGVRSDVGRVDGDEVMLDDREVETEDKVVFCALQSGAFEVIDLRTKASVYHSFDSDSGDAPTSGPPLTSIALSPSNQLLATGSSKGVVSLYDTRALRSPLCTWQRNEALIESLAFSPSSREVVIAAEDGLPYIASLPSSNVDVVEVGAELVGGDCEAIRCVRVHSEGGVWTSDEEGVVRGY